MKKTVHIPKSRLYGCTAYSDALKKNEFNGYKLERVSPGRAELSTGAVCFFDAYDVGDGKPFTERLPAGEYDAFMLTAATSNGTRVAFAGLDGGRLASATEWKLAYADEHDVLKLLMNESAGTWIGSGFGALCDVRTLCEFAALVKAGQSTFHPLDGAVSMDGGCAQVCVLKGVRLPVFSTGWGEGNYSCFFGYDGSGVPLGILCDCGLLKRPARKDTGQTVAFTFDMSAEELFVPDPKKSDAENSIAQYTAVIDSGDADSETLMNAYARRGYSYHTAGKFDEALGDYRKAIELGHLPENAAVFPQHAWSLYDNAALIYRAAGKTDEVIRLYKEAIDVSDTFYGGAYAGLIDVYRESKNYKQALAVADEMVAVRPKDPSAYLKRSELYMACEEYDKAIADLDVLIHTYKLNESILDKAMCLSYAGRHSEALKVIDTYLLDGRASEVYYDMRAEIHLADNNFTAAYIDAHNAFDVNPDYPSALEKLIELDGLLFHYKNVVKWATRYIELRPRTEYGYGIRAEAYTRLKEYEDAVADYHLLLRIRPEEPKYTALLIRAAWLGGAKGVAKKYQKLLRRQDDAYYLYTVGLLLASEKKFARAERFFASALALRESDVILSELIDCFIASGKYDKAEGVLSKYATLADAEEVFVKHARIASAHGVSPETLTEEYVHRLLGDCKDAGMLEKVKAFFAKT